MRAVPWGGCSRASVSGANADGWCESILGHFFSLHSLLADVSSHVCCQTLLQRRERCGSGRLGLRILFARCGSWPFGEEVCERRKAVWTCDMEFCDRTNGRLTVRRKETSCAFWRLSHGCSARLRLRGWDGDRGQFRTCKGLVRSLAVGAHWPGLTFGTAFTSAAAGPKGADVCPSRIEPASVFQPKRPPARQIFIRPCPNPDRSISQKHKACILTNWSCKGRSSLEEADSRTL